MYSMKYLKYIEFPFNTVQTSSLIDMHMGKNCMWENQGISLYVYRLREV